MAEHNLDEIWQVEVRGQIYEARFAEFATWIEEGSLQPLDKVRKGQLRWIEARRVPALAPLFEAKQYGLPIPKIEGTSQAQPAEAPEISPAVVSVISEPIQHSISEPAAPDPVIIVRKDFDPNFCKVHTDAPASFVCDGCAGTYCKACPNSYGSSVRICPDCGSMCRPVGEIKAKEERTAARTAAISSGFGSQDFFNALAHPFNFKVALIVGGLMFAFFSIG